MVATSEHAPAHVAGPAGCPADDCDPASLELVDVFCHDHEQFMPLRETPGVLRVLLLLGWGAAICWAFVLSAQVPSAVPVLLAMASVGAAIVLLPLRFYPGPVLGAALGWAAGIVLALLHVSGDRPFAPVLTVVTAGALSGWLVRLAVAAFDVDTPKRRWRRLCAAVASLLSAAATATLFTALAAGPLQGLFAVPGWMPRIVPAVAGWIAVAALLLTAGAAAVTGVDHVLDERLRFVRLRPRPGRIPTPRRPVRGRVSGPRDPLSQMARALSRFAGQVAHGVAVAMVMLGNAGLAVLHGLRVVLTSVANWVAGWVVAMVVLLGRAVVAAVRAAVPAARSVLVPVAGLGAGAWCLTAFSRRAVRYLETGAPIEVFVLPALAVAGAASLAVAWIALCGLPPARAWNSALRSAAASSAWVLLLTAAGGWVVGLLGTSGYGPVRVGWFTVGSTAVLVVAYVRMAVMRRSARTRAA